MLLAALLPFLSVGQRSAMIYGRLTDTRSNPIQNVNITVAGQSSGAITGKDGKYEFRVPAGDSISIVITCIGFETVKKDTVLKQNSRTEFSFQLKKSTTELSPVEIRDQQVRTTTFNRLDPKTVTFIPTLGGGVEDLIKTLPGVSSRNELSSQYSVRGGNYDENLVFVNDIEIYRPYLVRAGQQEGLSFINPDLVSSISFSAGGFEAKYGDKMSSVLDIRYKRPTSFAGSFDLSLLGASAHVEGLIAKKLSFLLGVRYKTNSYFLKGLDTKGNYKPKYFDVQGMLNYDIAKKWELSVLGYFSNNYYNLIPETRETTFGTIDQAYKIKIYFDGQEVDKYQNWLASATLLFKPSNNLRLKLIATGYQAFESETYDINSEYWIGKLETYQGSSNYGQVTEALGVGSYLDHARNYLNGTVFNIDHRGTFEKGISVLQWGLKYQHESFDNRQNEWELLDSAGYSLPHPHDSLGYTSPVKDPIVIPWMINATSSLNTNRVSAFLQNTWTIKKPNTDITVTAGLRSVYLDYNNQVVLDPRVSVSFKPNWKRDVVFRLAAGIYSQPPTFREVIDLYGNLVNNLKAQHALSFIGGSDLYFKAWDRPFKFVTEVYYKYLYDLIPYEVDNLKISYYGTNNDFGYAAGIDFRINGEFVKGVESWASLSFMKTEENIDGKWIPRPTDQRVNLSIFFQDYIPHYPTWRVNLTLMYGTGLPIGPPHSPRDQQTLRIPAYRRVDIGLSKQLIGENTRFSQKNPLRVFHSMWVSLEIFNLLQISNVVSYQWITDINGNPYAVPNYLTPRQFNLKLSATF
jgi:hypothetical protein